MLRLSGYCAYWHPSAPEGPQLRRRWFMITIAGIRGRGATGMAPRVATGAGAPLWRRP
jgi:hypothetical protein